MIWRCRDCGHANPVHISSQQAVKCGGCGRIICDANPRGWYAVKVGRYTVREAAS
ncbi:MAG: hypothetical protein WC683_15085 [bacterium]